MFTFKWSRKLNYFKHLTIISREHSFSWSKPSGLDTGVFLYNPIVKEIVPLQYSDKPYLSWYSCGPTVYDVAHIGHASCYIRQDIIRRVLSHWFGIKMVTALGITDIDDKIIARSKVLNVDFLDVSKKYEIEFFRDMKRLNLLEPHLVLRVTEHIPDIISFISSLLYKGHAYVVENGSVYFKTQTLSHYGKVTRAPVQDVVQIAKNGHPSDFALWKSAKPGEPSWISPWSSGRPGWHIECSVMASKIFGQCLDLHSGGLDLAFPHHENEEAQSCAFHAKDQWVNYWIHTGHLLLNGMKMSKSMKNFIPIETFLSQYSADSFRMLCLMTHYRTSIDYTEDSMKKAIALVDKFSTFLANARSFCKGSWTLGNISSANLLELLDNTAKEIKSALARDINTTKSITRLEELVRVANSMLHAEPVEGRTQDVAPIAIVADFVHHFLNSLGLFQPVAVDSETISKNYLIDKSVEFRKNIRQIALFTNDKSVRGELLNACDILRSDLSAINVQIIDTKKTG